MKPRTYGSLRAKLIILVLILSIIPLSLVTHLSFERSRGSLYKSSTKNFLQIAKDKAAHINNWLFERVSDARVISESPWIIESLKNSSKRQTFTKYLKLVQHSYGYYDEIFILDNKGNFIIGTNKEEKDQSDRDYFVNAITGNPVITDIRKSETVLKPTMLISYPIRDETGKVTGVLVERIKLDLISKIMNEIKIGKTGESYLLNKEGYFITESKFGSNLILKKKVSTEGYRNCLRYHQGVGEYLDYRGKSVLGSYIWIPERKWCLMVEQDVDEALSQIHSLRNITLVICSITIVLVTIISFWGSARIVDTLRKRDTEEEMRMKELLKMEKLVVAGKLTAGIAHEIGNPLTGIINCVKLIHTELDKGKEKVIRYLTLIEKEAIRCSKTINDFLGFTKEMELKIEDFNINQIIEDAIMFFMPKASSQKVVINKVLNGNIPKIPGDKTQLRQAFINIIMNSLDALPGGGKLYIKSTEENEYIKIEFSDTGCGIKEEHLDKIFEPFFTTKREGTGLGLSIVYNIIDKHNGNIEVQSEPGEGTRFIVRLPKERKEHAS